MNYEKPAKILLGISQVAFIVWGFYANTITQVCVFIGTAILFWLLWIITAGFVERLKRKTYTGVKKYLYYGFVGFFVIFDVIWNYNFAPILFLERATWQRNTLTLRLKGYLRDDPNSWRGKLSYFICQYLVDPHEPGHCGLS